MNSYQQEQIDALTLVYQHLNSLDAGCRCELKDSLTDYLAFRNEVDQYLQRHFGSVCDAQCFQSRMSACCSRDGIITFFADVVINVLVSDAEEIEAMFTRLRKPHTSLKCIYLGENGCPWKIKPIVCEMFLCDVAKEKVFSKDARAKEEWEILNERKKRYTWPDRPVLFDDLEAAFLKVGYSSPLMYMHNSPGLLRVKKQVRTTANAAIGETKPQRDAGG
jgi:hypothetical protein